MDGYTVTDLASFTRLVAEAIHAWWVLDRRICHAPDARPT